MISHIDFLGIGCIRSGSTWLAESLRQHPQIVFPNLTEDAAFSKYNLSSKEINFFNNPFVHDVEEAGRSTWGKGLDWYKNLFLEKEGNADCKYGEFSPNYMFRRESVRRIKTLFPNIKLILTLRNPVDMLHSFYLLRKRSIRFILPQTFEEAIEQGYYVDYGYYFKHLEPFFRIFGHQNIKVVLLDDIKNHPKNVVKDVYRFLGVSTDYMPNVFGQKINTGSITKFETVRKNLRRTLIFLEKIGLQSLIERLKHNNTLYKMYLTFNMTKKR